MNLSSATLPMLRNYALLAAMVLCALPALAGVITVTTLTDELVDNGQCSLREAVLKLHGSGGDDCLVVGAVWPPRIELMSGVHGLTIPGTNEDQGLTGDLDVYTPIDIAGLDQDISIIDGNGLDRIIDVHKGGGLRLSNLTLRDGRAPDVDANGSQRDASGGGIRLDSDTFLVIRSSSILNSRAGDGLDVASGFGGRGGHGGGIFAGVVFDWSGTLILDNARLEGNLAGNGGDSADGNGGIGGSGGAINVLGGADSSFLAIGVNVVNNSAGEGGNGTSGNRSDGDGGGIKLRSLGDALIGSAIISGNSAGPAGDPRGSGGGVHVGGGPVAVIGSTLVDNQATFGGAVTVSSSESLVAIVNSTLTDNSANFSSGVSVVNAQLVVASSTIVDNPGGQGGLRASGSFNNPAIFLVNSIIAGNAFVDCQDNIFSLGFNLVGSGGNCPTDGEGDADSNDPDLGSLQIQGGPTPTRPPNPTSPAVDSGNALAAGSQIDLLAESDADFSRLLSITRRLVEHCDQRGAERAIDISQNPLPPPGDHSDKGAHELGSSPSLVYSDRFQTFPGSGGLGGFVVGLVGCVITY